MKFSILSVAVFVLLTLTISPGIFIKADLLDDIESLQQSIISSHLFDDKNLNQVFEQMESIDSQLAELQSAGYTTSALGEPTVTRDIGPPEEPPPPMPALDRKLLKKKIENNIQTLNILFESDKQFLNSSAIVSSSTNAFDVNEKRLEKM